MGTGVAPFSFPHSDLDFVPDLPRLLKKVLRQKLVALQELILAATADRRVDRVLLGLTLRGQRRGTAPHPALPHYALKILIERLDTSLGYVDVREG
jgi:hypothetical protein